jgi:hypothetical protein
LLRWWWCRVVPETFALLHSTAECKVHILTALTRALGVSCFDSLATAAALRFTCDLVLMPEAEVIFGLTGLKVGIIISVLTAMRCVASRGVAWRRVCAHKCCAVVRWDGLGDGVVCGASSWVR